MKANQGDDEMERIGKWWFRADWVLALILFPSALSLFADRTGEIPAWLLAAFFAASAPRILRWVSGGPQGQRG